MHGDNQPVLVAKTIFLVVAMQKMQKDCKKTQTCDKVYLISILVYVFDFLYFRHFNVMDLNGGKIKIKAIQIIMLT
jgi:hypothetical protein